MHNLGNYYIIWVLRKSLSREVIIISEMKQVSVKIPLELYKAVQEIMRKMIDEGRSPNQSEAILILIKAGAEKLHV